MRVLTIPFIYLFNNQPREDKSVNTHKDNKAINDHWPHDKVYLLFWIISQLTSHRHTHIYIYIKSKLGILPIFAHNYMETSHVACKPKLLKLYLGAGFEPTIYR